MKKILVMFLVLAMFASLMAMPAMADDTQAVELSGTGVTLYYPQSFTGASGIISSRDGGELGYNTGWYYAEVDYTAMSNDEYNALMEKEELTEEEIENYYNNMGNLFMIFAVPDKSSIEELAAFIKGLWISPASPRSARGTATASICTPTWHMTPASSARNTRRSSKPCARRCPRSLQAASSMPLLIPTPP